MNEYDVGHVVEAIHGFIENPEEYPDEFLAMVVDSFKFAHDKMQEELWKRDAEKRIAQSKTLDKS